MLYQCCTGRKFCARSGNNIFNCTPATAVGCDNNQYDNRLIVTKLTEPESKSIEHCDNMICKIIAIAIVWFIYVIIDNIVLEFNVRYENIMFFIGLCTLSNQL